MCLLLGQYLVPYRRRAGLDGFQKVVGGGNVHKGGEDLVHQDPVHIGVRVGAKVLEQDQIVVGIVGVAPGL